MEEHTGKIDLKPHKEKAVVRIIGIGTAGWRIAERMADDNPQGIELFSIGSDMKTNLPLEAYKTKLIALKKEETDGDLASGSDPEEADALDRESEEKIKSAIQGSDMVIITCGEGGSTGTAVSPLVAHEARTLGILTAAVVVRPFAFEQRAEIAQSGIEKLEKEADAIIVIDADNLAFKMDEYKELTPSQFFSTLENVAVSAIKALTVFQDNCVNTSFKDVKNLLKDAGIIFFGMGLAKGENSGANATRHATRSNFVGETINGATKVICTMYISKDVGMREISGSLKEIQNAVAPEAQIFFGVIVDRSLEEAETVKVTVVASDFQRKSKPKIGLPL